LQSIRPEAGDAAERATPKPRRDELLPALYGALVIAVTVCGFGLLLTHAWRDTALVHRDLAVERFFARNRSEPLDAFTEAGTFLADTITVSLLWPLAMLIAWRWSRSWLPPLFILVTVGCEKLMYLGISVVVDRSRPPVEAIGHAFATKSFPSGHVASAVTLYGSIAVLCCVYGAPLMVRRLSIIVAVLTPFIVAFCRMYRGFHYPTDVVAGALLGVGWLVVTTRYLLLPSRAREILASRPGAPAPGARRPERTGHRDGRT
jgi:membrane-associated phospholipid phosphatase